MRKRLEKKIILEKTKKAEEKICKNLCCGKQNSGYREKVERKMRILEKDLKKISHFRKMQRLDRNETKIPKNLDLVQNVEMRS